MLDKVVAEAKAGATYYEDPVWRVNRASIALARGDLERASAGSEKALNRARKMKDAQVLAPALAFRGIVLLEEAGVTRRRNSRLSCSVKVGATRYLAQAEQVLAPSA
jgi:hypothetical protein